MILREWRKHFSVSFGVYWEDIVGEGIVEYTGERGFQRKRGPLKYLEREQEENGDATMCARNALIECFRWNGAGCMDQH